MTRAQPSIVPGFRDDMDDAFGPRRTRCENNMQADMDERFYSPSIHTGHEHGWITPHLAVGSVVSGYEDVAILLRVGITHVLDLCELSPAAPIYPQAGIAYLSLPAPDDGTPREWTLLRDGVLFADRALREGGRVLVHCHAGISRSTSMCYAILRVGGFVEQRAVAVITAARPQARLTYKTCADKRLADLMEMVRRDREGF